MASNTINKYMFYEVMRCSSGSCGQHPSTHNGGYNHCEDCNDDDELSYTRGINLNIVSCGGAKCRCSFDQWDNTPLYCVECNGSENSDEDLQDYISRMRNEYEDEDEDEPVHSV